jgi:hypothetical protein
VAGPIAHACASFSILVRLAEVKMPSPTWLTRRALAGAALALLLTDCGGQPVIIAVPSDERALMELANVYRDYSTKNQRGPKSLKDLKIKGQQYPIAVEMIKSGDLVVRWGATPSRGGETPVAILAYVKMVPEQGGKVLMQDCKTIKQMTADEFRTAEKAGGH